MLAGLLLGGAIAFALAAGTPAGAVLRWILGAAASAGCVAAGWTAGQLWRHAELLRDAHPCTVDEAIHLPAWERDGRWLLLDGHLGSSGEVTSPGGVVCAFYEAELRLVGERGEPGRLVTRERAASVPLELRGLRKSVRLRFSPARAAAPVSIRRVLVPIERDADEVPATGEQPAFEVLSWESVGKLGARALALGTLEKDRDGSWRLVGIGGGAAPVVLPSEQRVGRGCLAKRSLALVRRGGAARRPRRAVLRSPPLTTLLRRRRQPLQRGGATGGEGGFMRD